MQAKSFAGTFLIYAELLYDFGVLILASKT